MTFEQALKTVYERALTQPNPITAREKTALGVVLNYIRSEEEDDLDNYDTDGINHADEVKTVFVAKDSQIRKPKIQIYED